MLQEKGILVGISNGATIAVATQVAVLDENRGKLIIVIIPGCGICPRGFSART